MPTSANITTSGVIAFTLPVGAFGVRVVNESDTTIRRLLGQPAATSGASLGIPLAAGAAETLVFDQALKNPLDYCAIHAGTGNKTLSYEVITQPTQASSGPNAAAGGGGTAWGDIVGTLSNQADLQAALDLKTTNTAAAITGGTATGLTSLGIRNAGTGAFDLTLAHNGTLTAGRSLTFDVGDANRTLTLGGNLTLTGGGTIALGGFTLTIPATGTAALLGANTFTAAQTITVGTVTVSTPLISTTQTWNAGGVTFIGEDHAFTKTAAATGSLMARWSTASRGTVSFEEGGEILLGSAGSAGTRTGNAPAVAGSTGGSLHVGCVNGSVYLGGIGTFGADVLINGVVGKMAMRSGLSLGWSADNTSYGTLDAIMVRDAANIIAQRNSTNAQTNRIYGTYTDASNYTRLSLAATSTTMTIACQTAGTGADDIDLTLTPAGTGVVQFGTHSAVGVEITTGYITIKDAGGTSRKLAVIS